MPDFHLQGQEAADVAAYLTGTLEQPVNEGRKPLEPFELDAAQVATGRLLFQSRGCVQCHEVSGVEPTRLTLSREMNGDCGWAHYGFSPHQVEVLQAGPLADERRLKHRLAALACYACHEHEGIGGPSSPVLENFVGDPSLGNEGTLPPGLTGVGGKVTPEWLGEVLRGRGEVRAYLETRMPFFGETHAQFLENALGRGAVGDWATGDPEAGRQLLGTEGGVGCITCHGLGERQGLTLRALPLNGASRRYRPAWFREYLIDPARHRPGTLMPSFWPQGEAGNREILGGDTDRQIASIWAYLDAWDSRAAKDETFEWPPGYPPFEAGAFELIPSERPIVQRTFMEGAGTHAIAVGFPAGIHLAFDAERCRLALAWKGRFIDAYRPWFSRLDPTAEPLEEEVYRPETPRPGSPRRFRGYRLDSAGVPTFHFVEEVDGEKAREHWQTFLPDERGGLRLRWKTVHPDGDEEEKEEAIRW